MEKYVNYAIYTIIFTSLVLIPLIPVRSFNVVSDNSEEIRQEKILDEIIDRLSMCESGQVPDIKVLDSNNKYSYGWLQYQSETFNSFARQYGLPHNDIMSPEQQIAVAKEMIKDGLGDNHWVICWQRKELQELYNQL